MWYVYIHGLLVHACVFIAYINPLTRRAFQQISTPVRSAARAGFYVGPLALSLVPFYSACNGLQSSTKYASVALGIQNKMAESRQSVHIFDFQNIFEEND